MFRIVITDEQREYAMYQFKNATLSEARTICKKNRKPIYVGILGEIVFADFFGFVRPKFNTGPDEGYDYILQGQHVDIKTTARTCYMKDYFVHKVSAYQLCNKVDIYIFLSINTVYWHAEFCGYIYKHIFLKHAVLSKKGDIIKRADGTRFTRKADTYIIQQEKLSPIKKNKIVFTL
jgi:hypothetical protein